MTPAEVEERYVEDLNDGFIGIFLEGIAIRIDTCNRTSPFCVAMSLIVNDAMQAKDRRIAELEAELAPTEPHPHCQEADHDAG